MMREQDNQLQLMTKGELHDQKSKINELQDLIQKRELVCSIAWSLYHTYWFRTKHKAYSEEHRKLLALMQNNWEAIALQYKLEVENICKEMKASGFSCYWGMLD